MEDDILSLSPESYSQEDIRETRADMIRTSVTAPDFSPSKIQSMKDVLSESTMQLSDAERQDILRSTGVYASTGKQTAAAIENALIGMNQLGDELTIAYGNVANYITGGALGEELQNIAYESMASRYAAMADKEDAVGGIRSELAQLAGGGTSFLQLALEGIATAGVLPLAHIGAQSFGEGVYNDMKEYADKHDGSLEGYKPKGIDLAVNTANALLQVAVEHWLGVGSPRFLVGASRGAWVEGLSGALQEGVQDALSDLAEVVKGNEEIGILLDNAENYLRSAVIGGILQGAMGAATHHQNYAKATNNVANAIAKARGHENPTTEDQQQAEAIIDAKERQLGSVLTQEFKAVFDASTGEGKLQANIAKAIDDAIKAKELDLGIEDETERAQRVQQIATQETLNAMEMAQEQGRAVSEMELNNVVYRDGAIWLEGLTPQVGERAADYARVLAERQSGLAEALTKLDAIQQEVNQTKKDLAEARAANKEAYAQKLQARLDKQNAMAEKRRLQAEKLRAQTDKIEAQIAKEFGKESAELATPKEPLSLANVAEKTQKKPAEKKSLKQERAAAKVPEQQFLFQETLDNEKNGTTISATGGSDAKQQKAARTAKIINAIRGRMRGRPDAAVWVDTSTGDSGVQQTAGVRSVNLSQEDQAALNEQGISTPNFTVYDNAEAGAQEFLNAMEAAKAQLGDQAASVDVKELSDYQGMKTLILSEDKKTGCAITKDGDIVSVFSASQERGRAIPMLLLAVQNGGTKLDCYDIYLPAIYSKVGFKAVARNNWVEIYKPDGWDKEYFKKYNNGEPDVVFMVYDPNNTALYNRGDGKLIKSDNPDADYGAGMAAQDEALAAMAFQEAQRVRNAMIPGNQMLRQEELDAADKDQEPYEGDTIVVDGKERTVYNSNGDRIARSEAALTNFWRWFGGSKVVDEQGRPMVVYHGTTREFDTFDMSFANVESDLGRGFYFTNDEQDVAVNYEDGGPDFNSRIERIADKLVSEEGLSYEEAKKKALAQEYEADVLYSVYLKMDNPFIIGGPNETILEFNEDYNEETEEYGEPSGDLVEFLYNIDNELADLGIDLSITGEVLSLVQGSFGNSVKAQDLIQIIKNRIDAYAIDYESSGGEIISNVVGQNFDGFIDNTVSTKFRNMGLTEDTTHYVVFESNQVKSTENEGTFSPQTGNMLKQSKAEGSGSDKYRGGYDEKLKRIVLGEKSDLTTIQHEMAHYWMQNNFKWARSGLASQDWLRRWRDVEEALGIEPQDRLLSRQASEKFARAYERYIMEGKVADDLKWAFDGFQKFYQQTYEDLENEYFDLSEELDPAIVDWFNRQRPATEQSLKEKAYKNVAQAAMAEGADVVTPVSEGTYTVSSMDKDGNVTTDLVVSEEDSKDSKLAQFSDTKKNRRVIEGLRESNENIQPDKYNTLNRAATVEEAKAWVAADREGAWAALNSDSTNIIDRTALFQAFKELAEDGDYQLGADLANTKFPKQMTEVGQAIAVLGERGEFDPLTILEEKQKSLGVPTEEELASEIGDMDLDVELTEEQVEELKETTECVL